MLVLKGEGEFFFEPQDITKLEIFEHPIGYGLKIRFKNKMYALPIILWTGESIALKQRIEAALDLKNTPAYGDEADTNLPEEERLARKRWFCLN